MSSLTIIRVTPKPLLYQRKNVQNTLHKIIKLIIKQIFLLRGVNILLQSTCSANLKQLNWGLQVNVTICKIVTTLGLVCLLAYCFFELHGWQKSMPSFGPVRIGCVLFQPPNLPSCEFLRKNSQEKESVLLQLPNFIF